MATNNLLKKVAMILFDAMVEKLMHYAMIKTLLVYYAETPMSVQLYSRHQSVILNYMAVFYSL